MKSASSVEILCCKTNFSDIFSDILGLMCKDNLIQPILTDYKLTKHGFVTLLCPLFPVQ